MSADCKPNERTASEPQVRSSEWLEALVKAVNRARYRGPYRDRPMEDRYHWPMRWDEYEDIAHAALGYVAEMEKASNAEVS